MNKRLGIILSILVGIFIMVLIIISYKNKNIEAEKLEVQKQDTHILEAEKAVQGEQSNKKKEITLSDKDILTFVNNAQESFFKVTRNVEEFNNCGILSEEFNSPEKLEKYLNLYWSKGSSKELMNFIGAKYIDNKYCITLGDAPNVDILGGEILKIKQEENRIYLTIKAYCFDEAYSYDFELKLEDNKWVADYFEGSFGVIGQPKEEKGEAIQNAELRSTEVTIDKALEKVWNIVPNKATNTGIFLDREEVRDGVKYFVIHVYDNMSTHVATRGWYYVNSVDGRVYEWDLAADKLNLVQ